MLIKLFSALALTSMPLAAASSDTLDVDLYFLNYLIVEAKKSQSADSTCKYLTQDEKLFDEFTDFNKPIVAAKYTNKQKDKISVFIPISKPYRPGLVITINLGKGECISFELGEVMN